MNWKKPMRDILGRKKAPMESSPVNETIEKKNRRKQWTRVFTVMACVVVFATTYGLILPAITIEQEKAEEMPGLEYETAFEMAEDGDLLRIVPEGGKEGRIAVVVETDTDSENGASVLVLENDPEAGVQITEVALDDPAVSMLTPEEAVQVEGLEEEVLYLVQAAEEEGILEPEEQEALEEGVQVSLEELGVVDSSAAPQNDNSDVILNEVKDLEEDSSAVPQNDIEEQAAVEDSSAVPQNDIEEQAPAEDSSAAPQNDNEEQVPQNDNEVQAPQNDSVVMTGAFDCIGEALDSILLTKFLQETLDGMTITARYAEGVLPEDVRMKAVEVDPAEYTELVAETTGKSDAELKTFDITFMSGDRVIQPNGEVKITFQADFIDQRNKLDVVHIADDGTAEVVESKVRNDEVSLKTDSFSVYAISYTVDFHWDVDGEEFEFKLAGGTGISLRDLLTAQNVIKDNPETARDEVREFLDNIENVTFSNPDLAWVGTVRYDNTISSIKEYYQMECEYSADLTEEEIADMNSRAVLAGEWAFVSKAPFTSEETLTITMKNGEVFTIRVTDAQISTQVITADGEDFVITVTYGDDAQIPDGAKLEADEIVSGTKAYEDYLAQAQAAISNEKCQDVEADNVEADKMEEDNSITFARFFDIRIKSGEEKIEPAAPVQVTVTYASAMNVDEDQSVYAVHFGEKGTEVINTSSDKDNKSVAFLQDSFSVTGTVVTSDGNWPASGSSYVMYVQSGNNYYAVDHDGNLHQVTVSGNSLTFPDDAATFDLNNYLWTYEEQSSWQWWVEPNRFVYYIDDSGSDYYLSPGSASGIGENSVNLGRDTNGKISANNSYIGVSNGSIIGQRNQQDAVSIQFADFPKSVTIHFVDRDGNPLTGVSYTGSGNYPVTANADGTFTVPYNWNMGNMEYTLQLDKNFSKEGYTYASTHLAGTRQGTPLKQDGLTIDAALKERNNTLYYYTDAGDNRQYGTLLEKNINSALTVPKDGETDLTSYVVQNVNKDIYVILDPVPTNNAGQGSEQLDVEDPEFNKTLEYNDDGTYTLSLNVKGHGINAATNPKANVIFVVDTSSSMAKGVKSANDPPTAEDEYDGQRHSRISDTKPALKTLANELLLSNSMSGKDSDTVEVSMISFDGGVVDEIGWTTNYNDFADQVDTGLVLHRGTDWEDALNRAYTMGLVKQAEEPDQQLFVVFFTDGEASQYSNFHGQGSYNQTTVNPNYQRWYNYFLSRESAKDEGRAIVNAGMQFYAIYAYNKDGLDYNGEKGSDLLKNLVKYAYNSDDLGNKNFFAKATSTQELQEAFNSILLSVREFLGFSDVVMNDDITSLTSTGINLVSSAVGGFTYTRSGGRFGNGTVWTDAPAATHTDTAEGDVTSVNWNLGNVVLEDGVTYTVSFKVWPNQEAYDWLANLQNGTKTWQDVVAAGLDAPNGTNPQIVKNGDSYSLLTNKPSLNNHEEIINNKITYKKTHSETVAQVDIPAGTPMNTPIEGVDSDGNKTITTYTVDQGVYTKTVVTEKKTYFPNPKPMPLVPERMGVLKKWETSINASHPADQLKFRVLVDGKYYQNDGSLMAGDEGQTNAKVLPVSGSNSWTNYINIAPGIVKYYDDDGNALSEALVLETGHKYTLEEFDLMENGSAFLYYTSYEFHSQTMRPMIVDGTLKYLVLIDEANPKPDGAETCPIGTETYYVAGSGTGQGTLSGTNYRRGELDITKVIENGTGVSLTDDELNAETFTYRVTLRIPDGTDPAGIVGYEYIPRTQNNAYTLFGYQEGETAFPSDIERFSGKTFRSWNTLVYRDLVEWENVGGRIVSKTDADGNIIWKVQKDAEGYHNITYDMTLNRNEVIRFTNLPTGTKYTIQEIYANHYKADNSSDSAGHAPIDKASNIAQEGYEITGVLTTNGTVAKTAVDKDTVSGTIDKPNVRYYNQFTNTLKSVKVRVTILKTDQDGSHPLPGAVFDLYDKAGYEADPKVPLQTGLTSSDEEGKIGTIDLGQLADGVYYLVETSAPGGYNLLLDPVVITVENGNVTYEQENSSLDDDGTGISGDFHNGYQLKVVNDEGAELPHTGGPGTEAYLTLGALMAVGAGAVLIRRKLKRQ